MVGLKWCWTSGKVPEWRGYFSGSGVWDFGVNFVVFEMEANTEFEEGEAFFCYKDDDDDNIDLDSLSYIVRVYFKS